MSASSDIGPGTVVEMYRGTQEAPFTYGARFVVVRAWEDPTPCRDCLPGFAAPAVLLADVVPPAGYCFCSCIFRPVRNGGAEPLTKARDADAREGALEGA